MFRSQAFKIVDVNLIGITISKCLFSFFQNQNIASIKKPLWEVKTWSISLNYNHFNHQIIIATNFAKKTQCHFAIFDDLKSIPVAVQICFLFFAKSSHFSYLLILLTFIKNIYSMLLMLLLKNKRNTKNMISNEKQNTNSNVDTKCFDGTSDFFLCSSMFSMARQNNEEK